MSDLDSHPHEMIWSLHLQKMQLIPLKIVHNHLLHMAWQHCPSLWPLLAGSIPKYLPSSKVCQGSMCIWIGQTLGHATQTLDTWRFIAIYFPYSLVLSTYYLNIGGGAVLQAWDSYLCLRGKGFCIWSGSLTPRRWKVKLWDRIEFTVRISSSPRFAAIERDRHSLVCITNNYSASEKVNYMLAN